MKEMKVKEIYNQYCIDSRFFDNRDKNFLFLKNASHRIKISTRRSTCSSDGKQSIFSR